jgi:hypothetical protein
VPGVGAAAVLAIPPGITEIIAACYNSNNFLSQQLDDIPNYKYLLAIIFVLERRKRNWIPPITPYETCSELLYQLHLCTIAFLFMTN